MNRPQARWSFSFLCDLNNLFTSGTKGHCIPFLGRCKGASFSRRTEIRRIKMSVQTDNLSRISARDHHSCTTTFHTFNKKHLGTFFALKTRASQLVQNMLSEIHKGSIAIKNLPGDKGLKCRLWLLCGLTDICYLQPLLNLQCS